MGRSVSIRTSYRDDASFLIRLEKAVEADSRQDQIWRDETVAMIRALAIRFLAVTDLNPSELSPEDLEDAEDDK